MQIIYENYLHFLKYSTLFSQKLVQISHLLNLYVSIFRPYKIHQFSTEHLQKKIENFKYTSEWKYVQIKEIWQNFEVDMEISFQQTKHNVHFTIQSRYPEWK